MATDQDFDGFMMILAYLAGGTKLQALPPFQHVNAPASMAADGTVCATSLRRRPSHKGSSRRESAVLLFH